jgi:calcyclin binding protein
MVDIEEVMMEDASSTVGPTSATTTPSPSDERLLDAEEIEQVAKTLQRPTARMQLESLAKKLRREASALQVVERQSGKSDDVIPSTPLAPTSTVIPPMPPKPIAVTPVAAHTSSTTYIAVDRFSFDAGGSSEPFVTLYVPLPGVGSISNKKEQVQCHFEKDSFDLIVHNLNEKSYRLKKDSLEHDIVAAKSKIIIKSDKIIVKLAKVKGEYGSFDYWSKLTDPKRKDKNTKSSNPAASITELMKDMYESGDDNMRKMIGETMLKQHRGELGKGGGLDDLGSMDDL